MLSLDTKKLPPADQILLSLALVDWEKAEGIIPDHALFSAPATNLVITSCGGACPTQAMGEISGVPFYFRARHGFWTLGLGEDPVSRAELEMSGEDDTSGWMSDDEVRTHLNRAAKVIAFLCAAPCGGGVRKEEGL